ncbi:MAG: prolyl oligopeptidase family serine peptidase [Vicinamibacteria bacterium]|nr:prolyl oligopeptidase family serine peptidase [Vicinamibacteria bacterium]
MHQSQQIRKDIDDWMWFSRMADIAKVDKVRFTSKPPRMSNPTGQGYGNPLIISAYTFIPLSLKAGQKAPLMVVVHQGIHGNYETLLDLRTARELLAEGYVIVAPEYRGSTGYGGGFYDQIDYGGAEIDDTYASRNWAVENLPVDPAKVGIMGFSHGGYHTLMNILTWPKAYQVAYAGVPVSDLIARMGYKNDGYRDIFEGFIGKSADQNVAEYKKRSPYALAAKLETPLLIHSTTNDEDVNVLEVEHLIDSLKAAGKKFEYKIYDNAPGGHYFNRIDTPLAKESRKEILAFLAKYLK